MQDRILNPERKAEAGRIEGRALAAYGLWLRIGVTGAGALVVGLLQLLNGEVKPLSALALAAGGSVLAAIGWRRGRAVLGLADGAATVPAATPSPAGTRTAGGTRAAA